MKSVGQSMRYASILIGYPFSIFLAIKAIAFFTPYEPHQWVYFAGILTGHVFSLIYIIKGLSHTE
jgi:hypothetical protein